MTKEAQQRALVERAYALFEEFRAAYAEEWQRLEHCERMYRGDHWYDVPCTDPREPRPVTPILQSTVENVAADLLDQFPEATITAETPEDHVAARVIEALIRQNHDAASYIREYQKLAHDLLVAGYMVQEVGYDTAGNNGLGRAFIRHADVRGMLFDPLVTDMQEGRAVFKLTARPMEWFEQHYPEQAGEMRADAYTMAQTATDGVMRADLGKSVMLLEYWWREHDAPTGRTQVHMAQLAGGVLLKDSRAHKPHGYFAHGQYPFVLTTLFARKGSALGLGLVDMFGTQQRYADKMDQIMLKNALMASHNKLLVTSASGFDVDDLRDWSRDVHRGESLGGVTWFSTPPLPAYLMSYVGSIRESIKEESGANDFSRGGAAGGITAASAIAALQEASSKRARMASRQMHEAFRDAVRMEIEVEREFNLFARSVPVTENGEQRTYRFESGLLTRKGVPGGAPIEFYISIKVQRENRWSVMAQNELVMQLVQMGVVAPPLAVELMQFEGRELVLQRMREAKEAEQKPDGTAPGPKSAAQRTVDEALRGEPQSKSVIARLLGKGGMQQLHMAKNNRRKGRNMA